MADFAYYRFFGNLHGTFLKYRTILVKKCFARQVTMYFPTTGMNCDQILLYIKFS